MSWSEDRVSTVVIGGAHSPNEILANSVFQGTVLGPPLRNLFYADARIAFNAKGFTETVFADDFNCWRPFVITRDQIYPAQVAAFAALKKHNMKCMLGAKQTVSCSTLRRNHSTYSTEGSERRKF